jgi:hypothetical protein
VKAIHAPLFQTAFWSPFVAIWTNDLYRHDRQLLAEFCLEQAVYQVNCLLIQDCGVAWRNHFVEPTTDAA